MDYRVLERTDEGDIVIDTFESAYDAVEFVTACWHRGDARSSRLHIVDSEGTVLLQPSDLLGVAVAGAEAA